MKGPLLAAILFLALLQACSPRVHMEGDTLPGPLPEGFTRMAAMPSATMPEGTNWWNSFGDEHLSSLIQEALARNLDIAQAAARLRQARAIYRGENAGRFPFVDARYQRSRESRPGFFGTNSGTSYSASVAAGFEIDLWKRLANKATAARLEEKALGEDLRTARLTVSAQVADLYYEIVAGRMRLSVLERAIGSREEAAELVERRYQRGLAGPEELYRARQGLADARARRPQIQASIARAEHALSVLAGRYPESPSWPMAIELPGIKELFPRGMSTRLLLERPDVRAAFLRLKADDHRVASAVAERFPSLDLAGEAGRSSTAFSTGAIVGAFWSLAMKAALPLLDAGKRRAEVERARAVVEEDLARYRQAVLRAFQEVEDALVANDTDEARMHELERRAGASASSLELARERYRKGLADYQEVLAAEAAYLDLQDSLIAARKALVSDRITLVRAIGGNNVPPRHASCSTCQLKEGTAR